MSKIISLLGRSGRFAVVLALLLSVGSAAIAQVTLRKSMDYDGDNKADYIIFRPAGSIWYLAKSDGTYLAQQWGLASQDYMVPGDYDGDGKADIAVWRNEGGLWYIINSRTNTITIQQWGQAGDEPVARDYNNDGITDFAVVRRINGSIIWYVLYSGGGSSAFTWGLSTDMTAPGDYDGDGRFDYAVYRPGATPNSQSIFYVYNPATNGIKVTPWGLSNDLVVPGDYDGDNKTDYAVVREGTTPTSNLFWYIIGSRTGAGIVRVWGVTGTDITTQGDYNGDGRTDVGVWRNETGVHYWIDAEDSAKSGFFQWGSPNDYPVASYDTH